MRDTGIGIEKKYHKDIFKKYHQIDKSLSRNAEGSGIGLSLVESIVELHGGIVDVDSTIGKGSTFTISLPGKPLETGQPVSCNKLVNNKMEMVNIEFSDVYLL